MVFSAAEAIALLVTVVGIAVTAFWTWRKRTFSVFKDRGIPGPEPSLISGNFDQIWNGETFKVLDEWSKTYGDMYGFFNGDAPFLMVKDLELLRRVFVEDFGLFTERGEIWRMLAQNKVIRDNVTFSKGYQWKFARRSTSMAFTASKLRPMVPGMSEAVDRFLNLLETRCREAADGEADVFRLLAPLAFDLVAETACGLYLDVQHKPNDEYFASARSLLLNVVENFYQRVGQFFSGIKGLVPLMELLESTFGAEPMTVLTYRARPIVALRAKDPSLARPDVIQTLLEAKVPKELHGHKDLLNYSDGQGNYLMHPKDIASNTAILLVAGFETVSITTACCVFCLAKYPDVQEKVRKEVNAVYDKHGSFSYDAVTEMPYTVQTIFETLRLYSPVIAFTSRKASCDYSYKDLTLPKGVSILASTEHIHKDPSIWDRPEEFDPDRFSPEQRSTRNPLAFQPYGIGPRNCVGMKLAQLEMTVIIAKLVHRFRLHLSSRHENGELKRKTQSFIASPKDGVWVRIEKL
ncbi:cytochrome P450 3A24-like [Haemaphysalis longicornis]